MRRPSSSNHRRAATAGPHLIYPHQRLFLSDHMSVLPRCDGFEDMFTKDMTEICFHWDDVVYISELTKMFTRIKNDQHPFFGGGGLRLLRPATWPVRRVGQHPGANRQGYGYINLCFPRLKTRGSTQFVMVTFKTCNCAARSSQNLTNHDAILFLPDKSPSNPPCLRVVSHLFHKKNMWFFPLHSPAPFPPRLFLRGAKSFARPSWLLASKAKRFS